MSWTIVVCKSPDWTIVAGDTQNRAVIGTLLTTTSTSTSTTTTTPSFTTTSTTTTHIPTTTSTTTTTTLAPSNLTHFAFYCDPTQQWQNGFLLNIQCLDENNNLVSFYSGDGILTGGNSNQINLTDIIVLPGANLPYTITFIGGQWTGLIVCDNGSLGLHTDILSFNCIDAASALISTDSGDITMQFVPY